MLRRYRRRTQRSSAYCGAGDGSSLAVSGSVRTRTAGGTAGGERDAIVGGTARRTGAGVELADRAGGGLSRGMTSGAECRTDVDGPGDGADPTSATAR